MKIFLSKQVESLTGSLGKGFGYSIQKQRNGFYSKRNSKGVVPPDGHWRFILACAEIAKVKLHISDIQVSADELSDALKEAHHWIVYRHVTKKHTIARQFYDAADIINLKNTFGL